MLLIKSREDGLETSQRAVKKNLSDAKLIDFCSNTYLKVSVWQWKSLNTVAQGTEILSYVLSSRILLETFFLMLLKSILFFSNSWQRATPQIVPRSGRECKGSPGQPADWLSPQLCTYRQHKTVIDSLSSLWSRSEREKAVIPRLPPPPCFQSINSSRGFPHFWVEFPQKRRKCLSEYHVLFPLFISFFLFFTLMCSTELHCTSAVHPEHMHSAFPFPHFVMLRPCSKMDQVSFSLKIQCIT